MKYRVGFRVFIYLIYLSMYLIYLFIYLSHLSIKKVIISLYIMNEYASCVYLLVCFPHLNYLGHATACVLAVFAGTFMSEYLSDRTVHAISGLSYVFFAISTSVSIYEDIIK